MTVSINDIVNQKTAIDTSISIKTKPKCCFYSCNRKLGLTDFGCRCKKRFCAEHRGIDKHNCDFNYKPDCKEIAANVDRLRCVKPKIEII